MNELTGREVARMIADGEDVSAIQASTTEKTWQDLDFWSISLLYDDATKFRRKPKPIATQIVNGFVVPMHETAALKFETEYWIASTISNDFAASYIWMGDCFDLRMLERGLVFLNAKYAVAKAKAMCGVDLEWKP